MNRRSFLAATGAAAGATLLAGPRALARRRDRLRIGVVGVGNRGAGNLAAVEHEEIAALCDVDRRPLDQAAARHPDARTFRDWRDLVAMDGLDAVVVSTPDHAHFPIAKAALEAGKDVYVEKPLTHTVSQARELRTLANARRAVTQMGTQIHAGANYRRVVEAIRAGAVGPVREVHVFCSKSWSGGERPTETPPVPEWLDWDLWLCGAPPRPYHSAYHPAGWRRFWAFGGGTLGDMGCHYLDLAWWALDLTAPTTVDAKGPPLHDETTPGWSIVDWEHPAHGDRPACRVSWYDGAVRPALLAPFGLAAWTDGVLFVGDDGWLVSDYDRHAIGPEARARAFTPPPPSLPDSIGHHREWTEAIRGRGAPTCPFSSAGPLTEAVLLGNVAFRVGKRLAWDDAAGRVTSCEEANALL
ncbi:MAG: Gfo/Idh/MocA family protein [Planctomycetota bacterium JB042]